MHPNDVTVEQLGFRYARRGSLVIDQMSYGIPGGTRLGIYGRNGAGKTTFLNLLSGYFAPSHGRILLGHDEISSCHSAIATVAADFDMFTYLSLLDNVIFFLNFYGMQIPRVEIEACFGRYELREHAGCIAADASRGMLRKTQIIAALLIRPRLLIADEPLDGLDEAAQQCWFEDVRRLSATGVTIVSALHDMDQLSRESDVLLKFPV